jgi:hypothetical protein
MKKCIAFRPLGVLQRAWIPCGRYAVDHSAFCKRHADAMHGAVLGLWVKDFFEPAEPGEKQTRNAAGKKETPGEKRAKPARLICADMLKQGESAGELRA